MEWQCNCGCNPLVNIESACRYENRCTLTAIVVVRIPPSECRWQIKRWTIDLSAEMLSRATRSIHALQSHRADLLATRMSQLLCCVALGVVSLVVVTAAPWNSELRLPVTGTTIPYNQTTLWHTQKLDHFDLSNNATYQQRYFVIDDFWKAPFGPVIL